MSPGGKSDDPNVLRRFVALQLSRQRQTSFDRHPETKSVSDPDRAPPDHISGACDGSKDDALGLFPYQKKLFPKDPALYGDRCSETREGRDCRATTASALFNQTCTGIGSKRSVQGSKGTFVIPRIRSSDTFPWPQAPTKEQTAEVAAAAVALRAIRREKMAKPP